MNRKYNSFSLYGVNGLPRLSNEGFSSIDVDTITPNRKKISIYIHIPFCESACNFCHLRLGGYITKKVHDNYVFLIVTELKNFSGQIKGNIIDSVYFGGGTPSLLKPSQVDSILECLYKYFNMESKVEISFEGNSNTLLNNDLLQNLKINGVSRISFGVQTFNKNLRKILGRTDTISAIYKLTNILFQMDFEDINIDYIYNLPNNDDSFTDIELNKLKMLSPTSIDLHPLKYSSCNKMMLKNIKNNMMTIPTSDARIHQFNKIRNWMLLNNYKENFIGFYSRNKVSNLYINRLHGINGSEYIGVGLGARSYIGDYSFSNTHILKDYNEIILKGNKPIARVTHIPIADNFIALFPKRNDKLFFSDIENSTDPPYIHKKLNWLLSKNYVIKNSHCYKLTHLGVSWYQNIQEELLSQSQKEIHRNCARKRNSVLEEFKGYFDNLMH